MLTKLKVGDEVTLKFNTGLEGGEYWYHIWDDGLIHDEMCSSLPIEPRLDDEIITVRVRVTEINDPGETSDSDKGDRAPNVIGEVTSPEEHRGTCVSFCDLDVIRT